MLVGSGKCDAEDSAILSGGLGQELQTVERRQHAELKLKFIVGGNLVWNPLVEFVFGEFNVEGLLDPLAMS